MPASSFAKASEAAAWVTAAPVPASTSAAASETASVAGAVTGEGVLAATVFSVSPMEPSVSPMEAVDGTSAASARAGAPKSVVMAWVRFGSAG